MAGPATTCIGCLFLTVGRGQLAPTIVYCPSGRVLTYKKNLIYLLNVQVCLSVSGHSSLLSSIIPHL